jgi:hypothetical protein
MTIMPGAVRRCTRILWPGKASEKTPKGVIPPVGVKYRRTPGENTGYFISKKNKLIENNNNPEYIDQ